MQNRIYGSLPEVVLGHFETKAEMMFAQYYPIKLAGDRNKFVYDQRFEPYRGLMSAVIADFIQNFGREELVNSYVYITVKNMYQHKYSPSFNREGYHSDGFMTNDINYIWSDRCPTIFNKTEFFLSRDDKKSIFEMEFQAKKENEVIFKNNCLLRLDQYCIHKTGQILESGMRNFCKISISRDKYDLEGNAKNHKLVYNWPERKRELERNIPQQLK